jgi:hypothetical protein
MLAITLHIETAGTLPTLIEESQKYQITDLTLTGNLNGTDIRYIREMAGRDYRGNVTNGKLAILNLADANIVSGGDYYIESDYQSDYYTIENIITVDMFRECSRLESIIIPNSVISIGNWAFSYCYGLTSITIPNSVISIGSSAFYVCKGLTRVIIPNSVKRIGQCAFYECAKLTSIIIPNSVKRIGSDIFSGCSGLKEIHNNNAVPQRASSNCFYKINTATCKLYIPKGSYRAYSFASGWNDFYNVIEE